MIGSNKPLKYVLYVKQPDGSWQPQTSCDQSKTSCNLNLGASATMYVIAINHTVGPPSPQTPQLFGCYPTANSCQQVTTGKPTKTHHHKR
ncbi:MAG: hypothetical protein JO235_17685 [Chroococcidiopsidaceae cyanobacterium CP_BM_RX_35]|nr:hypothetical protein [Chroococcidiopsidaceae cyanobacterium CP_BM_RX_35]